MFKCSNCNNYYDISPEHYERIEKCIEQKTYIEAIVICPICQKELIVGGQPDWDPCSDGTKECIHIYSTPVVTSTTRSEEELSNLEKFIGIQLLNV